MQDIFHKSILSGRVLLALVAVAAMGCAAAASDASIADSHTVTFRRLNGTVLSKVNIPHGGSLTPPAAPEEDGYTFKAWDHADWLASVTKDVTCWALYEKAGYPDSKMNIDSASIAAREQPYTLDEYFQMFDNVAWSDEFSESALKANFYSSRGSRADVDISAEVSANRIVENGLLKLRVQREDSGKYHFTSGEITTSGRVTFKKGRIEIRAKLNYARGTWPSFWTMNSGWWTPYNEIDVFEQLSGSDWIGGTLHTGFGGSVTSSSRAAPEDGVRFRDGFHRIGAIVTDRELVWYVDDHIFKRMDITESAWSATPTTAKYLLLCSGLCAGGWLEGLGPELKSGTEADIPADFMVDDYEIDYLRIYTNTNADNTVAYDTPATAARLSGPVSATVWRGYDLCYGKKGGDFTSNVNKGYDVDYYVNTALDHHFRADKADIVAFLSIPDDPDGELKSAFDLPGKSATFIDTKFRNDNGWKFQESRTGFIYDSERFETASAGFAPIFLSSDANFTNCYAVCADLKEKATGARVKVVAVNVIATNGVENAGGVVAQGFDTLFAKLNDMVGDNVILFLQGWSWGCWNYVKTRAATDLSSTYSRIGDNNAWPAYQSAYAAKDFASASAVRPDAFPVPKRNSSISYQHNPQALQATVAFGPSLPSTTTSQHPSF